MNEVEQAEDEIKSYYKQWLAEYVAKVLEIKHRFFGNDLESYESIFDSCHDSFYLTKEEEKEIFDKVDSILTKKYNLLVANDAFNEDKVHLIDLEKGSSSYA